MREIKFKFWNKCLKKMSKIHRLGVIWEYLNEEWGFFPWEDLVKLQHTGLQDRSGTGIYEGDILKYVGHKCPECGSHVEYPDHKLYKVFWSHKEVGFVCENDDNYMLPQIWGTDMEIIGNVFEMPELLDGDE